MSASPRLDARKLFPIVSYEKVYFSSTKQVDVTKQKFELFNGNVYKILRKIGLRISVCTSVSLRDWALI